jgi:hypothetical protein
VFMLENNVPSAVAGLYVVPDRCDVARTEAESLPLTCGASDASQ